MEVTEDSIGLTSEPYTFVVESRHVMQFQQAIGDYNPLYTDESYAEESPYKGAIIPPTFPVAMNHGDIKMPLELDQRRMLHGEQEFIYHVPIRIGDTLHCQMKVADIYEKEGKSGKMQFIILDTEMSQVDGTLACVSRMNIIYRPAA